MEKREHITGIFSTQEVRKVGTGTTSRKTIHKSFWYCVEMETGENAGKVEIQPLNTNYVPSGPKRMLEMEQFLADFSPEPEFYVSTVFPRMRDLGKTIARAERHRDNKEYYSAEMEFNNALKVDEENVRANFGLGLTYLERNEVDKAENIFNRLVRLEATFEPEHKHLFNEFGIQLRKNKMYKESMEYYQRALELSNTDENIYYNMARVALESKDPAQAVSALLKCLEMNPGMEEGLLFLSWMKDKNMVPAGSAKEVEQTLKKARIVQSGAREPAAQPQGPREQPPDADKPA